MIEGPTPLPRRLRGIDVARAAAATAVMLSHLVLVTTVRSPSWTSSAPPALAERLARWMSVLGAWGVGLFFVLSGLCIHLPMARRLAEDPGARLALRPYYARRFTRIYPPHLVALLASALLALLLPPLFVKTSLLTVPTWGQLLAHLAMVHSFIPGAIFSISGVMWTIALETHFYLLYPLILAARRRYSVEAICLALFALSILVRVATKRFVPQESSVIFDHSFLRRFWEWALGCVIAERLVAWPRVGWIPPWVLAFLLAGTYLFGVAILDLPLGGALQTTAWPLLFAVVIECAARLHTSDSGAASRWVAWVGHTSYSLYLSHPIALAGGVFLAQAAAAPLLGEVAAGLLATLILWPLFFYTVERPFLNRASRTPEPPPP